MATFSALLMARLVVADSERAANQPSVLPIITQFLAVVSVALWLANDHKLLWGMAIHDHLAVLGAVIAAYGADRLRRAVPLTDSVGIVLAVFGAVVWGALWWVLLLSRVRIWLPFLLLGLGALLFFGVMHLIPSCYDGNRWRSGPLTLDFLAIAQFIFGIMGGIFLLAFSLTKSAWSSWLAILFGASGITYLGWRSLRYWRNGSIEKNMDVHAEGRTGALLTLAWTAVGAAFLVALGRLDVGNINNLFAAPRFAPISVLFWTALLGLYIRSRHKEASLTLVLACVSILLLTSNFIQAYGATFARSAMLAHGVRLIIADNEEDRMLAARWFQPNRPTDVLHYLNDLESNGWDIYRNRWTILVDAPLANLGEQDVNAECVGQAEIIRHEGGDSAALVRGWARLSEGSSARMIYFVRDDIIVGAGLRAPVNWFGTRQSQQRYVGSVAYLLSVLSPATLQSILGLHAEWIGAARIASEGAINELDMYTLTEDGRPCLVAAPEGP